MTVSITVEAHPLLYPVGFSIALPTALGSLPTPKWLLQQLDPHANAPIKPDDTIRTHVRDLLRHGGYKPSGRGKPASEYLVRAADRGGISHINLVVDACNAVSLHSGLPISVVDLDRTQTPLWIGLAQPEARYVFNASGQEIRLGGLICLGDQQGPCANAVKDSQRTKTCDQTRRAVTVVWAPQAHTAHADAANQWYQELLTRAGATIEALTWRAGTRSEYQV